MILLGVITSYGEVNWREIVCEETGHTHQERLSGTPWRWYTKDRFWSPNGRGIENPGMSIDEQIIVLSALEKSGYYDPIKDFPYPKSY